MRARVYDPATGSFLQKDPAGIAAGANTYVYVSDNPVNLSDPSGEDAQGINSIVSNLQSITNELKSLQYPWQTGNQTVAVTQGANGEIFAATNSVAFNPDQQAYLEENDILQGNSSSDHAEIAAIESLGSNPVALVSSNIICENCLGYLTSGANAATITNARTAIWPSDPESDEGDTGLGGIDLGGGGLSSGPIGGGISGSLLENGLEDTSILGDFSSLDSSLLDSFGNFLDVGGVLINKAATLVGSNLNSITGATYDPVTQQIVYLGTTGTSATTPVDMDYFYTAVEAVYGSAVPPYVTIDPPALAVTGWINETTGSSALGNGQTGGFVLEYDPIWGEVGENVSVEIKASTGAGNSGTKYDFTYNFTSQTWYAVAGDNGYPYTQLVYVNGSNVPNGITLDQGPFQSGADDGAFINYPPGKLEIWYLAFNLTNNTGQNLYVNNIIVTPSLQHREFGGRVDQTKMGWVMFEADRVMKCLGVGKDNLTGAIYSSTTPLLAGTTGAVYSATTTLTSSAMPTGYKNLVQLSVAANDLGGDMRMWFEPNQMTLQRYVDPNTGQATSHVPPAKPVAC